MKLKKIRVLAVALPLMAVAFTACGDGSQPAASEKKALSLKVAGSTTVLPIVTRAADLFKKRHPGVEITINAGGSGVGVTYAAQKLIDIGMVSRNISDEERAKFAAVDLREHIIAKDAVACAISSEIYDAGVTSLSREQIKKIYLGEIDNWKLVGGPDRKILVLDKEHHRGTRHVFMSYIMEDKNARAPGADLITGANNEEQAKIISSDSAIGMLSYAWLNDDVKGVSIVVGDKKIPTTKETIVNGDYPIARDLVLVTTGEPAGISGEFIDFIRSEEGRKVVEESGYVPLN